MRLSAVAKRCCIVVALLLGTVIFTSATPSQARASTDVMFVFDTTGSMGGALDEAAAEIQEAMTQIGASLPDTQFGLAEMRDYSAVNFNGFPTEYELEGGFEEAYDIDSGNEPWTLKVPITANQPAIASSLSGLVATGGGDGPESYGRALYETDVNPAVGWRPGARGVIVLVADNLPHDADVNEGIPPALWASDSPFYTSPDPGIDNVLGTADDLDWQNGVLQRLINDGKPLEYVDYFGASEYFPYWQNWTARTGGSALQANGENLAGQIVELVKAGATAALPSCPSGQIRDAGGRCVPPPPSPPLPLAPSNNFKIEPRISCAKGCYVVEVKIVFDSAGNVIAESVLNEQAGSSSVAQTSASKKGHKPKPKTQIRRLSQAVTPGVNTLKLKLTAAGKKALKKKGSLKLKVRFTFTPTGGSPKSAVQTLTVKPPPKQTNKKKRGGAK